MIVFIKKYLQKIFKKLHGTDSIFYIHSSELLPPPLTKEEESEILQNILNDKNYKREPLIVHNLRLVVYIAKKFESSNVPVEDLISIGTIGLIKAVNTFCPEKKIKLATYASRCIENEILMFLRKSSQNKNVISIDEPLNVDWDGNELLLSDVIGSDRNVINNNIELEAEKKALLDTIANLPDRERTIMELRFGIVGNEELTQKQVADKLGISQSYISRLEKKIIKKLHRELNKLSI